MTNKPLPEDQHIYEIYTKNPKTKEGGWDINWVRSTYEMISSFPLFDEIITVDDYPMQRDGSDIIIWLEKRANDRRMQERRKL